MIKVILTLVVFLGYTSIAYAVLTIPRELKRIADQLEHINNARK